MYIEYEVDIEINEDGEIIDGPYGDYEEDMYNYEDERYED